MRPLSKICPGSSRFLTKRPLLATIEDITIPKALVLLAIPINDRMNTGWSQTGR